MKYGTFKVNMKSNEFPKIAQEIPQKASVAVRKTATEMRNGMVRDVPVITGKLKASIALDIMIGRTWALIKVTAKYAGIVNFGARGRKAKPYFTQNVERGRQMFAQAVAHMLKEIERR